MRLICWARPIPSGACSSLLSLFSSFELSPAAVRVLFLVPHGKALEKMDRLLGAIEKSLWAESLLVFESVVRLVSVCLIVGPVETDLRKARRNLSRIAIMTVEVWCTWRREKWYGRMGLLLDGRICNSRDASGSLCDFGVRQ